MIIKPLLASSTYSTQHFHSKSITLIDYATGEKLVNAHVISPTHSSITDKNGQTEIRVKSPDELVTISYMGYETEVIPFKDISSYVQLIMANNELDAAYITSTPKKKKIWPWVAGAVGLLLLFGSDKKSMKI